MAEESTGQQVPGQQVPERQFPGPLPAPATTTGQPVAPTGGPASPPGLLVPVLLLTLGRVVVFAAIVALLWVAGLGSFPGLLFGLLLSMPVSYVLLRPLRDRVTEGLAARSAVRSAQKAELRAQLRGDDDPAADPLS